MDHNTILLIEGKRTDTPNFDSGLIRKGYSVSKLLTGSEALKALEQDAASYNVIVVNAASMRTTGQRICQSIRRQSPELPIVLITEKEVDNPDKIDADVILTLPFTLQKLLNRIKTLLPNDCSDVLQAGPLQLDVEHRIIRYQNKQGRLTPRLVLLLKLLMEHAGEVIEREYLFRSVWDTAYTDDMRTLDVHISWLRQYIEDDPRNPRYLKTVRGVGYRLDI